MTPKTPPPQGGAARTICRLASRLLGGFLLLATGLALATAARAAWPANCPGYTKCPMIDFAKIVRRDPEQLKLDVLIAKREAAAVLAGQRPDLPKDKAEIVLGKAIMFDVNLSARRNQTCASCHSPLSGYAEGVPIINQTTVTFPGSVPMRTANRKPPPAAYAAFAPILHYRAATNDFVGGTFWDARATGLVTGIPVADQAMAPLVGAAEMALPDKACAAYRIANGAYAGLFTKVFGADSLSISWPANAEKICAEPNNGGADQEPLKLSAAGRMVALAAYTDVALAVASFEGSPEVVPFSSKYDAYLAGKASLTDEEAHGLSLFVGKAKCRTCHDATGQAPLFTDFTASNIGVPANANNPFYYESLPDYKGYVANPAGTAYVDDGLGVILAMADNRQWQALAPDFIGTFQVSTLRNVAAREGTRAYMHNGFFTSLQEVVHFYNTRDVLPHCSDSQGVVGVTCWPAPAQPANLNTKQVGNLHLTAQEENAIVTFLRTLTDGYKP